MSNIKFVSLCLLVLSSGFFCSAVFADDDIGDSYGFSEIEIIKSDWQGRNLCVADFDGDGRGDIAIANNAKARIDIYLQKEAIGSDEDELFEDAEDVDINAIIEAGRFKSDSVSVSQKITSFVNGDLNSDGLMDIAFYGEPAGLYVILQKKNEQAETEKKTLLWHRREKINIEDGLLGANSLFCADLNGDRADDLVLAGRKGFYIIWQKSDGTLAEPINFPSSETILGIEAGDLNADGMADLILVTSDKEKPIRIRLGMPGGQLGPETKYFIEGPWALTVCDIEGISGDQIVTVDGTGGRVICYTLSAKGDKSGEWPIVYYPLEQAEKSGNRDLIARDFDGDGFCDVVISDPGGSELIFYRQAGGSGLTEPVRFPAFSDILSMSAADMDGDKMAELAVISVREKLIGISDFEDGRFCFPKSIKTDGEPVAMTLADIDNDKRSECVYISKDAENGSFLRVIKNPGSQNESHDKKYALKLDGLGANPDGIRVIDIDQDGLKDVLIFVKYEDPTVIRQIKGGQFEKVQPAGTQASLIKDASLTSIAVANIDKTAGEELLIAGGNFARSVVFSDSQMWKVIDQYNAKSTENQIWAVSVFNIDGETANIFLLDGKKGQLQILKADEDNTYRFEKQIDVGRWGAGTHLKILYESLTGDESKSILLFDGEKFAILTLPAGNGELMNLEELFRYETKIKDGRYGNVVCGDINSDKKTDFVTVEYQKNHIEILTLDAAKKPVSAFKWKTFEQKSYQQQKAGQIGIEPREMKIADVTDDGKNDLVTLIHDRIIIYPQD